MKYRQYGKDGPMVSALGFGVMRLPERRKDGSGGICWSKAIPVMRAALDAGVNFFDTHHNYHDGLSEEAIGRVLRLWRGPRPIIQSKTPFYRDEPLDYFKRLIDAALRKMGVDWIDYLLFHSMDIADFRRRGRAFFRLTDWAIKRGVLRHRGFSSHDTPENIRAFIDSREFSSMVVSYNWLNSKLADTIAYGADAGLGVAVMNPVQGGHLASDTPIIRRLLPQAKSSPELALRFVLATPGVAVAMSGMSTIEQVAENAATASRKIALTKKQWAAMLARLARIKTEKFVCTACGYCMPCPHGVDIPTNLLQLSRASVFGLTDYAKIYFNRLRKRKPQDASALACMRCGACLPKCPNGVDIVEELSRTAKVFE